MNKKILQKILIFLSLFFFVSNGIAYNLTQKDENFIDIIDSKIIKIIDNGKIKPEKVVNILEIFSNKSKSQRVKIILSYVIDDIKYEYFLGEYADEIQLEDDFLNTNLKGENKPKDKSYLFTEYQIINNKPVFKKGLSDPATKEILEIFIKLIPENYRQDIKKYKAYDDPEDDSYAYIEQESYDKSKWIMIFNLSGFYVNGKLDLKESIHSLIHEFAHILTLNKTQVSYNNFNNCNTYLISEGCLKKDSYFYKFIDKFWKNDFKNLENNEKNDFYTGHETDFVTEYAAINPGEDIAESFTYFVLKKRPKPKNISDQKILFFYKFKELVNLRNNIRKNLK